MASRFAIRVMILILSAAVIGSDISMRFLNYFAIRLLLLVVTLCLMEYDKPSGFLVGLVLVYSFACTACVDQNDTEEEEEPEEKIPLESATPEMRMLANEVSGLVHEVSGNPIEASGYTPTPSEPVPLCTVETPMSAAFASPDQLNGAQSNVVSNAPDLKLFFDTEGPQGYAQA